MEQIVRVARSLREQHGFRGYIHLKTIPEADPDLVAEAGRYADRVSINIELPTEGGLARFAPEKRASSIRRTMASTAAAHRRDQGRAEGAALRAGRSEHADDRRRRRRDGRRHPRHQRDALRQLRSQAHLLLGLQPDPGRQQRRCPRKPRRSRASTGSIRPTGCSASTASRPTRSLRACRAACSISTSIRSSPGRCAIAAASRSTSTRQAARSCLRVPGLGSKTIDRLILARRHRTPAARRSRAACRVGAARAAVHRHGRSSADA